MVDVTGQDGTEGFENAAHSDKALKILEGMTVGNLKHIVRFISDIAILSTLHVGHQIHA